MSSIRAVDPLSSDDTRVALRDLGISPDGGVIWTIRGRYVTLTEEHTELLRQIAAQDGGLVSALAASDRRAELLEDLTSLEAIVMWRESAGLPIARKAIGRHAVIHLLGRAALAVFGRRMLRVLVDLTPDLISDERQQWRGFELERVLAAARRATSLPLVSSRCLPMCIGLWFDLRLRGLRVRLRLGAIAEPFHAHSWLEYEGSRIDPGPHAFPARALRGAGWIADDH
jgi:hypothetical protein